MPIARHRLPLARGARAHARGMGLHKGSFLTVRNYIETFWLFVQFTDGVGFDNQDFVSGTVEELAADIEAYRQLLITVTGDDWTVNFYGSEPDGDRLDGFQPSRWYVLLDKANLIEIFKGVSSGLTFLNNWRVLFASESPRDTWSHGE